MRLLLLITAISFLCSCERSFDAKQHLTENEYDSVLINIAPYVVSKPDEFSYEARFHEQSKPFYQNFIKQTNAELKYFVSEDTATFFFFSHKDLTSLYEHYRGLGGYFKSDENGNITFFNLLYHTPRFEKNEMEEKGKLLFEEMIQKGDVKKFIGNRSYIHTPNADFYYNTKINRWDYTENSSWKFLEEARKQADKSDSIR